MAKKIQLRGGTASEWIAANPILADREVGVETDTLKHKIGNGVTTWTTLGYAGASSSVVDATTLVKGIVQLTGDLGGTAASPTVPALAAKLSATDPSVTNARTPTAGSVVDASVAAGAAIAESKLSLASDAAAGTASRRSLGAGATQAAAGTDARFSDSRAPIGAASGDLSGAFPGPTVAKVNGVAVTGAAAAGKVLTASGAAAADWQTPLVPFRVVAGRWASYVPWAYTGATTSILGGSGREYAHRIVVPESTTFNGIGIEVTSAGTAGSLIRLGIRSDNNGAPGAVLLDAGTVAADTTGGKSITISQVVPAGSCWITTTWQGATGTAPTIRCAAAGTIGTPDIGETAVALSSHVVGYGQDGVSGALGTFTIAFTTGIIPRVLLKR